MKNISNISVANNDELERLINYYNISSSLTTWLTFFYNLSMCVLFPVACFTSVLTVIVLRKDNQFKLVSFYHQSISVVSIIVCLILTGKGVYGFLDQETIDSLIYIFVIAKVSNQIGRSIQLILIFMSLDRIVACVRPIYYRSISTVRISRFVVVGVLIYEILMSIPYFLSFNFISMNNGSSYIQQKNSFGVHYYYIWAQFDAIEDITLAVILFTFTTVLVITLKQINIRRQNLRGELSHEYHHQQKHFNYLLFSQVFLIFVDDVNTALYTVLKLYVLKDREEIFLLDFNRAYNAVTLNIVYHICGFLKRISYELTHMHFFAYLAFCKKFRDSVLNYMKNVI